MRTCYFDAYIEKNAASYKQLVILGAGFDSRCYRLERLPVRWYACHPILQRPGSSTPCMPVCRAPMPAPRPAYLSTFVLVVRSFEVDAPTTQAEKQQALAEAGIDSAHVRFVPVDFTAQD